MLDQARTILLCMYSAFSEVAPLRAPISLGKARSPAPQPHVLSRFWDEMLNCAYSTIPQPRDWVNVPRSAETNACAPYVMTLGPGENIRHCPRRLSSTGNRLNSWARQGWWVNHLQFPVSVARPLAGRCRSLWVLAAELPFEVKPDGLVRLLTTGSTGLAMPKSPAWHETQNQ